MTLSLISTAGDPAANSYASVTDATTRAGFRTTGPAAAWGDVDAGAKIQALVTATNDIDSEPFIGARATTTQALEWPRTGTSYDSTTIPTRLRDAVIELAFVYAAQSVADTTVDVLGAAPVSALIKREVVGPLTTEYFDPPVLGTSAMERRALVVQQLLSRFPGLVQRLLSPLIAVPASVYGTGTVVRSS